MSDDTEAKWDEFDRAETAWQGRDAILSDALRIASRLPRQKELADETLALVRELLDWREERRLPDPHAQKAN
ncbi:hypothetical protein [Aureimonas pseudogalii]|uniref:Uncharacterized protein n=1 Tax=Aureimonas pseudogalii TaxID=1744844 RepID=A0A7W6EFZ2_9HYPH|nr:hypothetical protein [Aureimonas pseudogalii]MBB3997184.1 hypothetical protein [Aureimonas pseudogalii]